MANKKDNQTTHQKNIQRKNEKYFLAACEKLKLYPCITAVLLAASILLFFIPWAEIFNTDIGGAEVSINGWACAIARLTGNFASTNGIYGDMAVPFYYYAPEDCEPLSLFSLIAAIGILVSLVLMVITMIKKTQALNCASLLLNIVGAVFLFLSYTTALSMNQSEILPQYCSSNPACSVRSFAVIPAVCMALAVIVSLIASIKYLQARKLLK